MSQKKDQPNELVKAFKEAKFDLISKKLIVDKKDKHTYPIMPPFETPNHYKWLYLSDASVIQEGPGLRKHQYTESGVQFLTVTNILEGSIDFKKSQKYIDKEEYEKKYKHFTIIKGDIVTACSGATWGKSAIFDYDNLMILNTSTLRLRFFKDLGENKYLYYFTKSNFFKTNLSSHSTGQQPNYGYSHYSKIPIPVPPLSEQKQIVETLDKAFEKIDKAIANIERNIDNAEEIFQSKLEQIFSETDGSYDISWKYLTFDNLVSSTQIGIVRNTKEQSVDFPVRYFKMNNIKNNNGIDDSKYTSINATEDDIRKYSLKNGDFLFNTRNSYELVGKTCVFRSRDNEPIVFNNNILRARFKDLVSSDFVAYAFCTEKVKIKLNNIKNGTTSVVGIYYKSLKDLKIPVPPLSEQKKIVENLDNLNNHVQSIIIKYKKELINLKELKKSILEKAFKGELTSAA